MSIRSTVRSDIPAQLGAANVTAIKRAMIGYINRPSVVYVAVIATAAEISAGFAALAAYSYDYLAGPGGYARQRRHHTVRSGQGPAQKALYRQSCAAATAGDDEGTINFVAAGIKSGATTITAAQYAPRIAGLLAGTPANCSATYAALDELTAITPEADPDTAVDAGKLILVDDGRKIKLGRAVTSKTKLAATDPEMLKKIKLVAAVDLIRYYAITTVEDEYLGKCANTYDNKCILLTALRDYLSALEGQGVIRAGSSGAELDADATRAYLLEQASGNSSEIARISALSNEELRKEDTGSHVFLQLYGKVLDAMEDFHIILQAQ